MNLSFITQAVGAAKLALKAKAPTIMVVGGITSMGVGTIVACKQTLKIEEVMQQHVPQLEKIEQGEQLHLSSYGDEAARSDRLKVYSRIALDGAKVYAVPAVLWVGGAGLVFGGHRILLKRNATLAIAFTSLKGMFDKYRERVIDQQGHEADQYYLNGSTLRQVVDPVTGEVAVVEGRDWDATENDPYNRIFEQGATPAWKPDLGVNKMFVAQMQRFAQERCNRQGYLYLSDVYESLGFPESDISRVVGWKVTRNPDGSKDYPVVDFGLDKPLPDDWKYNKDRAIYLDFNCQGLIVGGKLQKILERA